MISDETMIAYFKSLCPKRILYIEYKHVLTFILLSHLTNIFRFLQMKEIEIQRLRTLVWPYGSKEGRIKPRSVSFHGFVGKVAPYLLPPNAELIFQEI